LRAILLFRDKFVINLKRYREIDACQNQYT